jgi:hypothetical protein
MNTRQTLRCVTIAAITLIAATPTLEAQSQLPATQFTVLFKSPSAVTLESYKACSATVETFSRIAYVASSSDWLSADVDENGTLHVSATDNLGDGQRKGIVKLIDSKRNESSIAIWQPGFDLGAKATESSRYATVTSASASSVEGGAGVANTYDANLSTIYHSNWSGFDPNDSSSWPILIYNFKGIHNFTNIYYYPRSGASNGNFKVFELLMKRSTDSDYVLVGTYDFAGSGNVSVMKVPEEFREGVVSVKFIVHSGCGDSATKNFASCAEMKFEGSDTDTDAISWDEEVATYFSDSMLTALKDGVTDKDIESIQNPFLKQLAELMKSGEYTSDGKISSHTAIKSYNTLATEWSAPGCFYSQIEGVTGVMMMKGKYVVIVDGLDDTKPSINLRCIGWTVKEGQFFTSESFTLVNGVNIINKTSDWSGLAYVCNYNDAGAAEDVPPTVKVHIVGGKVNGIISNHKTNEENQEALNNACYTTIDCVGDKVQSVWEVNALKTYAKGSYVRYLNALDMLIAWEQRLLGFEKYNMLPKNHTLAYVNYNAYMYQCGMGVTFKYDTQDRVCSPDNIMYRDDDVVWGLSHEWGHQHQMQPYFDWGGMSEVTNNMNSCYNVLHMGYSGSRVLSAWNLARAHFLDESNTAYPGKGSSARRKATLHAETAFKWCPAIRDFAAAQDTIITALTDKQFAVCNNEVGVEETLAPFFMLHCYFGEPQSEDMRTADDYYPDYTQDLYESLRNTAKHTTAEMTKYELLARAQNGGKAAYATFAERYPTSVWIKNGYITDSSNQNQNTLPFILNYMVKASELCHYNLYPFFEKFGFFRNVAMEIEDYGTQYYVMMADMFDEIKADMDEMATINNWKTMDDNLVLKIANAALPQFKTPEIPNDRPLTSDDLNSIAK